MNRLQLRHSMMGLLAFTGVFHLVVAMFGGDASLRLPLAVFGVIFLGLSYYIRKDVSGGGPRPIMIAMALTAVGLTAGSYTYLTQGGPVALLAMLGIDIAILAAGAAWLRGKKA